MGQNPIFMIDLGDANDLLSEQVSFRLSLAPIVSPSSQAIKSSLGVKHVLVLHPMKHCLFEEFSVFVINNFLRDGGIVPMPNPQPRGPGFSFRVAFP